METYIYKMIALSAIFILLYFVFLEKEKNHHFKRFYLLISALFSVLVPLISINYGTVEVVETINQNNAELMILPETKLVEPAIFTTENILWAIYILGFSLLFLKFYWGIFKLIKEIKFSEKIKQDHYQFILKQNKFTPYSFWNSIFLNKSDFLEGKIDYKIILHEKAHVNQKHSIDVIFIEIMLCVFWFNPAFYFYRKAIVTNHEFLADETVLSQNKDIISYQKLILDELISEKILFTHPFNLHNTKKRIVMMTNKLTKIAKLKSYLTLPISALLFFAFVEKVPAIIQSNAIIEAPQADNKKSEVVFDNPYREVQEILSKYSKLLMGKKYFEFNNQLSQTDKKRLNELFPLLSREEKDSLPVIVFDKKNKLEKIIPQDSQLNEFLDSEKFGVWIDGRKVNNNTLKNYSKTDFSSVNISKVSVNTISSKNPQPFQVNLFTHKYFEKINNEGSIQVGIRKNFYDNDTIKPTQNQQKTIETFLKNNTKNLNNALAERKLKNQLPPKLPTLTPAEFPEGNDKLRQKILENFDLENLPKTTGTLKTVLNISISKNGDVEKVTAEGENENLNKEAIKSFKLANGNTTWKPGKTNGSHSSTTMTLPITMNFE